MITTEHPGLCDLLDGSCAVEQVAPDALPRLLRELAERRRDLERQVAALDQIEGAFRRLSWEKVEVSPTKAMRRARAYTSRWLSSNGARRD